MKKKIEATDTENPDVAVDSEAQAEPAPAQFEVCPRQSRGLIMIDVYRGGVHVSTIETTGTGPVYSGFHDLKEKLAALLDTAYAMGVDAPLAAKRLLA